MDSQAQPSTIESMRTALTGGIAAFFTWYAGNIETINQWLTHLGQLGGLVIVVYSILILRRNHKLGINSKNPFEQPKDGIR